MSDEEEFVQRAKNGDPVAIERLLESVSQLVYRLAIRMLGDPTDAQDASQEILMKIAARIGSFRGESAFRTWVYRVASNHLLTARKRHAEEATQSFEQLATFLDASIAADLPAVEDQAFVTEAKLTCNARLLLCLDRDHRLAYILGEIVDLSSEEGAEVLEISSDAFRKRLSRARQRMEEFVGARCGLVDPSHPCRCGKVAALGIQAGKLTQLRWAAQDAKQSRPHEIEALQSAVALFRSNPDYSAPEALARRVRELLQETRHAQTP
jgi:RNA polymerase sigma factor (sigma-70 family)